MESGCCPPRVSPWTRFGHARSGLVPCPVLSESPMMTTWVAGAEPAPCVARTGNAGPEDCPQNWGAFGATAAAAPVSAATATGTANRSVLRRADGFKRLILQVEGGCKRDLQPNRTPRRDCLTRPPETPRVSPSWPPRAPACDWTASTPGLDTIEVNR